MLCMMAYEALLVFHYCPDLLVLRITTDQAPQGRVDGMWLARNLRVGRQ